MKRSIAIKALSLYLSHNWAVFNESTFDQQAGWIIGFLEGDVGMQPPFTAIEDPSYFDNGHRIKIHMASVWNKEDEPSEQECERISIETWRKEKTSDREREFQSKKDSCV